jgi:hypothetical protein
VLATHTHGVALGLVQGDLPVWQVAFISCNDDWGIGWQVALQLLHPDVDLGPGLKVGDVINDQSAYTEFISIGCS